MKFAVFTHVEHVEKETGEYYAYAPYMREMNIWLQHVDKVEVVAPLRTEGRGSMETWGLGDWGTGRIGNMGTGRLGEQSLPYEHAELNFTEVPSFNFLNFSSSVISILKIPHISYKILVAMWRADHLHLRCPGNIGLLAAVAQIFFPKKPKSAKYAGNWDPYAKQPWTYRLQKWVLNNRFLTRNMQVLVYGDWPGQSKNIVPFFTASFSEEEKAKVAKKTFSEPFTFLFVGNLVEGKRPLEAIKLVEELNLVLKNAMDQEIRANIEIYGDGQEREMLENHCRENKLEKMVNFKGNRSLEELKAAYQKAHFVILPSRSEGWPKALAEGMFFGCIPIATPVSCVPWMLNHGCRGVVLEECSQGPTAKGQQLKKSGQRTKDREDDVKKIIRLLADREKMQRISDDAKDWSQQYTLERFEVAIQEVLMKGIGNTFRSSNKKTFFGSL